MFKEQIYKFPDRDTKFAYALFTQEHKKSSHEIRNCLIFFVDQPGT